MASKNDYLSHEEIEAKEVWKLEHSFLKEIYFSNAEKLPYLIKNITHRQLKAIILILIFIARKEIPLRKFAFSKLSKEKLKILLEFGSQSFHEVSNLSESELRKKIQPLESDLPLLIYPILKDE